jgi:Domain of unknown function DUF29
MSTYDEDFPAWTQEQAQYLREGKWDRIDVLLLAEEIEAVGDELEHAIPSHLTNLLMHLLKWRYQPTRRSRSWRVTIRNARIEIRKRTRRSRRLERFLSECFGEAYADARKLAKDETGLPMDTFPVDCKWNLDEIRREEWLPPDREEDTQP